MNLFWCCVEYEMSEKNAEPEISQTQTEFVENIVEKIEYEPVIDKSIYPECGHLEQDLMVEIITNVEFFLPIEIENQLNEMNKIHRPIPIKKIPTIDKLLVNMAQPSFPYKMSDPIPIDHRNRYL